jgi:hypothetical protein
MKKVKSIIRVMAAAVLMSLSVPFVCAQSLSEILMHFSEEEMEVPMSVRQKMVDNGGNTLPNYDNYKLLVYDKRARFLQLRTPFDVIYEIATWRVPGHDGWVVGLCETHCGAICYSKLNFYDSGDDWKQLPTSDFIPEISFDDIFNAKRLQRNYLTTDAVVKDLELHVQYMLPQVGHNIMVIFTCLDELDKKEYQRIFKYLDGTMLDLEWKKGAFIKSTPYFPAS